MATATKTKTKPKDRTMVGVWLDHVDYERVRLLAFEAREPLGAFVRPIVLAAIKRGAK